MISPSRTRRITNELTKYENEGISEKLNCYLANHDESNMLFIKFYPNQLLVNIVLEYSNDYPWKPPKITVNGHNYIRLLQIMEQWKLKYINTKCLCCSSILCKWCPANSMYNILKEIQTNKSQKILVKKFIIRDIFSNI